eukprot:CAMPEP_0175966340 /NCGR_PEP_ID=MMETSP0108-20121206/38626_1 /TAXON_ID=195067 ORGANISM="Goniomonas pacifica, Strain CCMP1869" /NCGR_SAMPLE_ID=MMETSP0108 /ASSEMBLY_ACC=CAM_ASM_000204 /LENGTH=237 /DNA_ID=CAMNT_0017294549 /DNA_START=114 /DNA_END=824 /DNA_ORIENTATION=-
MSLRKLRDRLGDAGISVDPSTICRWLQILDLPLKNIKHFAEAKMTPENQHRTIKYYAWMSTLTLDDMPRLNFFDEVGVHRRNVYHKRGRAASGETPRLPIDFSDWRKHYTCAALMGLTPRSTVWEVREGGYTSEDLLEFFFHRGLPAMAAGDILIMDNCRSHHSKTFEEKLRVQARLRGIQIVFLPKYSPELNPIESLFSKLKLELPNAPSKELFEALIYAFESIQLEDRLAWARKS